MTTERDGYIAGLRRLADLLESHDEMELPYQGAQWSPLTFYFLSGDPKADLQATIRAFPVSLTKIPRSDEYFDFAGKLDGLHFKLVTWRSAVCERVVIGTETVTRTVPDPSVDVPMVEVTEDVELVEWRCGPVLTGGW